MSKRSQTKRITMEAKILRHMRLKSQMSLSQAGGAVGISGSAIAHIEQGRMEVSRQRALSLVRAYGFTFDEYAQYLDSEKNLPKNLKDECILIIRQLDNPKVQAVHGILLNFLPEGSTP